ncbi:sensor histidine kinase [Endobacterium cereale]|uniref:sensor histidine kinase n=1 Tax=Endobacterium cereale TaxID=2663029 RepID=UPI002B481B1B|nr:HAMP domain-containing sensor histidine kinase [Endobacterium cereale]MEB2848067.1 HAMP domain-containing sensor histidine kinase [Endobacterium cereale]
MSMTFQKECHDHEALGQMRRRLNDLETSEARYRTLFNNVPAAVFQVDASGVESLFLTLKRDGLEDIDRYLVENPHLIELANRSVIVREVNDVAFTLFGAVEVSQLLAPVAYIFAGTPEASARVMSAHFQGRPNHQQRLKIKRFDGRLVDAWLMVSFPQLTSNFDTSVLMITDMTEQVRVETELRKMETEFAHFSKLSVLGEFSSAIVHEIRQPLSVVANDAATASRWLSRSAPNLPKVRELIQRIGESTSHATEVIKRVQDMASKAMPERQICDLNQLVASAIAFTKKEAARRSIGITSKLSAALPKVQADPVQVQQLVVNLMNNAMQAIERSERGPRQIFVSTTVGDCRVCLEVSDTGPGIPEDIADDIFESFFTTRKDGMGMGLSICRTIMQSHAGAISARNVAGGGAAFEVWLPIISAFEEVECPNAIEALSKTCVGIKGG